MANVNGNGVVVKAEPAYVLRQRIVAGNPRQEHEGTVVFLTEDKDELAELLKIFGMGKEDDRIIDNLPGRQVYEQMYVHVQIVGLFGPDGRDVWEEMKLYAVEGVVEGAA